jgi:hypothetical protein
MKIGLLISFSYYFIYTIQLIKNPSFFVKYFKTKSPSAKAKGLEIGKLPLLDAFRTFKGNITTEWVE